MSSSGSPQAQERSLPQTPFYSIEYPGYVQPASTRVALQSLGGQTSINNAFKRSSTKAEALVELSLNSSNPFAHPIPGEVVPTNNVLIKIIRRKRKHQPSSLLDETTVGDYTAEAVGVIPKTVRFRSMADFHFQPDMADEISQLRVAMNKMNVDAIHNYTIPEETSVYLTSMNNPLAEADPASMDVESDGDSQPTPLAATTEFVADRMKSNLRLFPPPLFSRQTIPQAYNFKANPASMVTTTTDEETGEEKKRLINRMRWKGYGPASIMFSDASVGISRLLVHTSI
ncbi:hypothetical protein AX16_000253 [Volvariella volvacea WC 439]|nr:hypothetical protein AX16_000253 [Volvariella volvacea WC 439]